MKNFIVFVHYEYAWLIQRTCIAVVLVAAAVIATRQVAEYFVSIS